MSYAMVFLKEFFESFNFEKKLTDNKKYEKFPECKELNVCCGYLMKFPEAVPLNTKNMHDKNFPKYCSFIAGEVGDQVEYLTYPF